MTINCRVTYSVFVCWYVTWPCDLDLWPFDLEQLSCMAGHVNNPATKSEDPIRLFVHQLRVITFPVGYHWNCVRGHYARIYGHFSNICTAHAQKLLLMNCRCKLRHRRSISRPRVPIRVQNFNDLATFSVEFSFLHFICWVSAIFLLPVCFTYWPRKYTTRVDPRVDHFHQVWSSYDHTLLSYSVFVCRYGTWPCDLDRWPFNLEQLSYMAGHMINHATKFDGPTTIRSRVNEL